MTAQEQDALMGILKARFEKNSKRHPNLAWADVQARLEALPEKLHSLQAMENTGGEPDVVGRDPKTDEYVFCDCAAETPSGRRSLCYDKEALDARKEAKPANNAIDVAKSMGVSLLDEAEYRALQELGEFDLKTSSWLATPADIRKLGGALFGDRRYGRVFLYHNGAQSYYAARGFRAKLSV